jgi:prepilin signal peptidase PulO-like enzyme (type II secretory pathway)
MIFLLLFIFGIIFGSFFNVVSMRYDGDHFLLDPHIIGGRSHCSHCGKTLRWFELVPLFSFLIQGGRCRRCKVRLSPQYPTVEFISGVIFVMVPWCVAGFSAITAAGWPFSALWILAFLVLLLSSVIDIRTGIIPDELNVALGVIAVLLGIFSVAANTNATLMGPFSDILHIGGSVWAGRVVGAIFGFAFFEFLLLVTRERGIGMGDVKLALPLGLLFGWPDILPVIGFAFICGALAGVALIVLKKKTMKATLPFGPFLAFSSACVFFFGSPVAIWYLRLIGV